MTKGYKSYRNERGMVAATPPRRLDRAGYLVEHRDETGHEVETTATAHAAIATDPTTWPGRRP